jgi:ribonuclease HI
MLLGEVERFRDSGMDIQFWRIGRELNVDVDRMTKEGAAFTYVPEEYMKIIGI